MKPRQADGSTFKEAVDPVNRKPTPSHQKRNNTCSRNSQRRTASSRIHLPYRQSGRAVVYYRTVVNRHESSVEDSTTVWCPGKNCRAPGVYRKGVWDPVSSQRHQCCCKMCNSTGKFRCWFHHRHTLPVTSHSRVCCEAWKSALETYFRIELQSGLFRPS